MDFAKIKIVIVKCERFTFQCETIKTRLENKRPAVVLFNSQAINLTKKLKVET